MLARTVGLVALSEQKIPREKIRRLERTDCESLDVMKRVQDTEDLNMLGVQAIF